MTEIDYPKSWSWNPTLSQVFKILLILITLVLVEPVISWLVIDAYWSGEAKECKGSGACWIFIGHWFKEFCFGFYPQKHLWRPALIFFSIGLTSGALIRFSKPHNRARNFLTLLLLITPLSWLLLEGSFFGLASVSSDQWGGIMLSVLISVFGVSLSLPFGVALALGRRSRIAILRLGSIAFIELWRSVPLVTILFMSSVMIPIFMPPGLHPDKLVRALIAVGCFSSAYMAEVIRGGLQSIPKEQFEASEALGLSYYERMSDVILPQAIVLVIPGMINNFIGLIKDTTLVTIIGMFDLLGMIQSANTNPQWLPFTLEGYLFAAIFYWTICFFISTISRKVEVQINAKYS